MEQVFGQVQICEAWHISRTLFRELQRRPDWPRPIRLGSRIAYRGSDLNAWLEKQVDGIPQQVRA